MPPDQAPFSVPPTAKDVCYQMFSGNNGAVEFTTDEATFRQWIAAEVAPAAWDRADVALLEKKAESVIRDYRGKSCLRPMYSSIPGASKETVPWRSSIRRPGERTTRVIATRYGRQ